MIAVAQDTTSLTLTMIRFKLRTLLIVLAVAPLILAVMYWTWPPIAIVSGVPAISLAIASWRYCRESSLPRWFSALLAAMIAVPVWVLAYLVVCVVFFPWGPL